MTSASPSVCDGAPALDDRAVGWLRYLYRKATTPDDWDRAGQPHAHWDDTSDPPMLCWHRFDLIDSTYAIGLMADRTPAWREVYGRILDELIFRHTGWWAARDWLTQIGHDPDRASYPDLYRLLIPAHLWGDYDVPGWTANGVEPWGLQMDPIGADGNLFFKGFFLVMLGLHLRTTGDERWNDPFDLVRDGENTFTWFHSAIADHLHDQWQRTPDGCHCENTKVWPYCLAGAGLGLRFHDLLRGTDHHQVFTQWWNDVCRDRYLHLDGDELPQAVTLYYDPILDVSHDVPVFAGMVPAIYLAPQEPEGARRLFEAGMRQLGLWEPDGPVSLPGPRASATALWLAREWGLDAIDAALTGAIDDQYEPSFDAGTGEFTWGFELSEEYPRGQYNGTMAAAQIATEGSWWRLANVEPGSRFTDPTVEGVDFPTVSIDQAWWDTDREELSVGTVPMNGSVVGRPTSFRIVNLDDPGTWTVADVATGAAATTVLIERGVEIRTTVGHRRFRVNRRAR
jgi:Linalool dehydratase/isomerase